MGDERLSGAPPRDLPDLPPDWEWKPLGDFVPIGRGISYGVVQPGSHDPNGVPILRAENVQNSWVDVDNVLRISPAIESRYQRTRLSGGELLITLVGAYFGKVAVAPDSAAGFNTARAVGVVPVREDAVFLSLALQSPVCQRYMQDRATTTAQPTLNLGDVERIPIPTPPLSVRGAIAQIIGGLDEKHDLNRRMNATLEAMARALFQSWFVDFDPVRAKLDGCLPHGIDPGIGRLFPDSFQDSGLGPIPRGWTAKPLPEAIEVNPRRPLKLGTVAPYLDMKNLPTQGHSADEVVDREVSSGSRFKNGDTLLARITPCLENGKTGFVDFLTDGQTGWGSTEYIVLSPKPPLPPQFGYLLARSDALRSHAIRNMTGTSGRQRVPSECFNNFLVTVPSAGIAQRFDAITAPLFARIKANTEESRSLAALRETLLPRLMKGELRV